MSRIDSSNREELVMMKSRMVFLSFRRLQQSQNHRRSIAVSSAHRAPTPKRLATAFLRFKPVYVDIWLSKSDLQKVITFQTMVITVEIENSLSRVCLRTLKHAVAWGQTCLCEGSNPSGVRLKWQPFFPCSHPVAHGGERKRYAVPLAKDVALGNVIPRRHSMRYHSCHGN